MSLADGAPERDVRFGLFVGAADGGVAAAGFVVGDWLIAERLADGAADFLRDFGEGESFRAGDGQGLTLVVAGGEGFDGDGGDVGGVDEGAAAIAGRGADDAVGFDGVRPGEQVRQESGGADEGEGNSAGADGGFALLVPCADGQMLFDVEGRKLDDVADTGGAGGVDGERIELWDARA